MVYYVNVLFNKVCIWSWVVSDIYLDKKVLNFLKKELCNLDVINSRILYNKLLLFS